MIIIYRKWKNRKTTNLIKKLDSKCIEYSIEEDSGFWDYIVYNNQIMWIDYFNKKIYNEL